MRHDIPDRGQSDTIGTVLLVGVVVLSVTTFGSAIVDSLATPTETTRADVEPGVRGLGNDALLSLEHHGGESIAGESLYIRVTVDGTTSEPTTTVPGSEGESDGQFDPGDIWLYDVGPIDSNATIRVFVADRETNAVVVKETFSPSTA